MASVSQTYSSVGEFLPHPEPALWYLDEPIAAISLGGYYDVTVCSSCGRGVRRQVADARIELARLYEEFGDSNAARLQLTEALDADATDSRAWAALGQLREKEGEYAQALANYQHAYNLNNFQPGVAQRITELQGRVAQNTTTPALPPPGPRTVNNSSNWVPR